LQLLALAQIYDGSSRSEAAKIGGVGLEAVRASVLRFNARGPDGLFRWQGARLWLAAERCAAAGACRNRRAGSDPSHPRRCSWRLIDLVQWLYDAFAVSLEEATVSRELQKLGFVKRAVWSCHHAQNEHALEAFKKKGGFAARTGKGQGLSSRRARR
jgi:transposase